MDITDISVVDAHLHFWELDRFEYAWPNEKYPELFRSFTAKDVETALQVIKPHPVKNVVFIQVHNSIINETKFVLEEARTHSFIKGVVGWVDLTDPNVEATLTELALDPHFVGVRHILDFDEENWLRRQDVQRGLAALEKLGLTYDLLVRLYHFPAALEVVKKFPNLKFVIDHIAKPVIKKGTMEGWDTGMAEFAKHANVYCKISGMVTETDEDHKAKEHFQPYVDHVIKCFGADRCLFASDWPVCTMKNCDYQWVLDMARAVFAHLPYGDQKKIFRDNAIKFYNLKNVE